MKVPSYRKVLCSLWAKAYNKYKMGKTEMKGGVRSVCKKALNSMLRSFRTSGELQATSILYRRAVGLGLHLRKESLVSVETLLFAMQQAQICDYNAMHPRGSRRLVTPILLCPASLYILAKHILFPKFSSKSLIEYVGVISP